MNIPGSSADIFYLAPLRGVTVRVYRNQLARFFAVPDMAVAPFVPSVAGAKVKPGLLSDIDTALEHSLPLVPQIIGKDADQLRVMLRAFKDLGYARADLNAGCPWPFVAKKGRGSGLLRDADNLARLLEAGCEELPGGFSIKVRLGLKTPDLLLERMAILNRFPLREVVIHARTARQMYEGEVRLDDFALAAAACQHPVVYNGDICSVNDFNYLKGRFPQINRWMIGRGLAVDPFLMESIRAGKTAERDSERLRLFLCSYLDACRKELSGDNPVMGRMKELWSYQQAGLVQGRRIWDAIKICRTVEEYCRVVDSAFRHPPRFKDDLSRLAGYF
ncbi:MAG: tRNA-dihydrouridine synthase family protein [Kiritimatiellae bacterium]|nr:tRNA-dihydrouridine synthase family protein [Kiritimatiellia bacterium]